MEFKLPSIAEVSTGELVKELSSRCRIFILGYQLKIGDESNVTIMVEDTNDPTVIEGMSVVNDTTQQVFQRAISDLNKWNKEK